MYLSVPILLYCICDNDRKKIKIWKGAEKIKCECCGSSQVSFTLNEELTVIEGIEDKTVSAPREHPFTMQSVGGQTLAVFTENSSGELLFSSAKCQISTPQLQDEVLVTNHKFIYTFSLMWNICLCLSQEVSSVWSGGWGTHPAALCTACSSRAVFLLPALLVSVCCELSTECEVVHSPNRIHMRNVLFTVDKWHSVAHRGEPVCWKLFSSSLIYVSVSTYMGILVSVFDLLSVISLWFDLFRSTANHLSRLGIWSGAMAQFGILLT